MGGSVPELARVDPELCIKQQCGGRMLLLLMMTALERSGLRVWRMPSS